ncbi:MAG: DUF3040 domain-containing protein [Acidimicrobiaceae bacterium]|nr:DUF3040 domain-containing protein [Acidimicrobiaceae bacterium]
MPLSEDEKRILEEIETHFYESDPVLAKEVSKTTVYTHALYRLKWSILGLLLGVVVMVATFSSSLPLAFCGFSIALAALLFFERGLRDLGRAGRGQMAQAIREKGVRGALGKAGSRMRQRFERGSQPDN